MDTSSIIFDGGSLAGWMIPSWHRPSPAKDGQDRRQDTQEKELPPDPAPSTVAVATPGFPVTHPVGQRFSYIRVSSADQNLARQREMIGPVDKEFLDKLSARSRAERPGLERCLDYLRDHDELTGSPGPWSTYARSSTRSPTKELPCTSSKRT